jgi:hypothetical protein
MHVRFQGGCHAAYAAHHPPQQEASTQRFMSLMLRMIPRAMRCNNAIVRYSNNHVCYQ